MPDTFAALPVQGVDNGSATAGNVIRATWGETVRQDLNVLAAMKTLDLGGSETEGVKVASPSWAAVPKRHEHELAGYDFRGLTVEAVVWSWTLNAATSVDWRVVDVDSGAVVAAGTAHANTTPEREVVAVSLPDSEDRAWYRLEVQGSDDAWAVGAWGYLRVTP